MIHVLAWCLFGLIAGIVSRMFAPGPRHLGIIGTIILGVCGSLIGGGLYQLIFENSLDFQRIQPAGFLGAVIGGIVLLTVGHIVGSERSIH